MRIKSRSTKSSISLFSCTSSGAIEAVLLETTENCDPGTFCGRDRRHRRSSAEDYTGVLRELKNDGGRQQRGEAVMRGQYWQQQQHERGPIKEHLAPPSSEASKTSYPGYPKPRRNGSATRRLAAVAAGTEPRSENRRNRRYSSTTTTAATRRSSTTPRKESPSCYTISAEVARAWLEMPFHENKKRVVGEPKNNYRQSRPSFSATHPTRNDSWRDGSNSDDIGSHHRRLVHPNSAANLYLQYYHHAERGSSAFRSLPPPAPPLPSSPSSLGRKRVWFGVMSDWSSAVDSNSGKTYYFNIRTRETQWRKPVELATPEERKDMERKERKQKQFFAAMEANILKNMTAGRYTSVNSSSSSNDFGSLNVSSKSLTAMDTDKRKPLKSLSITGEKDENTTNSSTSNVHRPLIRTISSMDQNFLRNLVQGVAASSSVPPSPQSSSPAPSRGDFRSAFHRSRSNAQRNVLEKIQETSKEFDYSATSPEFHESSKDFGLTQGETNALRNLAQNCQEMMKLSDDDDDDVELDLGMSSSNGFHFSVSDLHFSDSDDDGQPKLMTVDENEKEEEEEQPAREEEDLRSTLTRGARPRDLRQVNIPLSQPQTTTNQKARPKPKPALVKHNTWGTIYVDTTMSAPDKDATIKCVCAVYRAHILGSEQEDGAEYYDFITDAYRLFNDRDYERKTTKPADDDDDERELSLGELKLDETEMEVPDLDQITSFYRDVFKKAQMETDCIIMSLIYVERLIKVTSGLLRPRRSNWRSILFSCMVLSSKVWDDLSMWNADFSQTCPNGVEFALQRTNELELAVLKVLKYKVKVPASEYAKYYFLLRSMLIKSGLGGDNDGWNSDRRNPLDVEGAKRLQAVSKSFQNSSLAKAKARAIKKEQMRSKSMGDADRVRILNKQAKSSKTKPMTQQVNLEHLVKL